MKERTLVLPSTSDGTDGAQLAEGPLMQLCRGTRALRGCQQRQGENGGGGGHNNKIIHPSGPLRANDVHRHSLRELVTEDCA